MGTIGMDDGKLDLQAELFNEFQDNQKKKEDNDDNSVLNLSLLRETRIQLSFDTLLVLVLMGIFITTTFFFLGIQKGRKMQYHMRSGTAERLLDYQSDPNQPIVISKSEISSFENSDSGKVPIRVRKARTGKSTSITNPTRTIEAVVPGKTVQEKAAILAKKYTIQVAASKDREAASKDVTRLIKKGFNAFLVSSQSSSGSTWYKLCVGRYMSAKDASNTMKNLKVAEGMTDCFLTSLR